MSTQTQYIPIEIKVNNKLYSITKQYFVGNSLEAAKKTKELRKEFPKPEFVVRRNICNITIYKS